MTHTHGPWTFDRNLGCKTIRGSFTDIADTVGLTHEEEDMANARLIVAAPEMYDLLNEWLDTPFFETKEEWQRWVDDYKPRVEEVIARVDGD